MTTASKSRCRSRASLRTLLLTLLTVLALAPGTFAKPITYTAFTIADGKIGGWSFHNARVYLTMRSDTTNMQFLQLPVDPNDPTQGTVDTYYNPTGNASVTIISGARVVHANFAPNQVFVSVDMGNTADAPHSGARGVGFGSFTPTGIQPTYPLGIEDGILDWGDITPGNASAGLQTLNFDLAHNMGLNGRAWPCVNFLQSPPCTTPYALHTDRGDLYLDINYRDFDPNSNEAGNPLSAAYFVATLGSEPAPIPVLAPATSSVAKPISYHGYVITDVSLGGHFYSGAQVYFTVDGDARKTTPFSDGPSHGYMNSSGNARVTIVSGSRTVTANFDPGQIYVYFDQGYGSVGFGSLAGRSGYPLSITQDQDTDGLVENSSVGAVADIMTTPGDAQFYTPPTASLVTDLSNATNLSGGASSCVAFDPSTSICANLTPVPLKTDHGDFYIYEPYTADYGAGPYTESWGTFWSDLGRRSD
ncbi:hypothetical protein DYQ86_10855 [Acidobacteria bacterium AB60]|nr:hypothetical protein DYQ86_10855 [Acidobacteria bacterium AB60]